MRLPISIVVAAIATAFAAGPAQADSAPSTRLIGAGDDGALGSARAFTPPIGTDKGSVTAAMPTTHQGIIAILIG